MEVPLSAMSLRSSATASPGQCHTLAARTLLRLMLRLSLSCTAPFRAGRGVLLVPITLLTQQVQGVAQEGLDQGLHPLPLSRLLQVSGTDVCPVSQAQHLPKDAISLQQGQQSQSSGPHSHSLNWQAHILRVCRELTGQDNDQGRVPNLSSMLEAGIRCLTGKPASLHKRLACCQRWVHALTCWQPHLLKDKHEDSVEDSTAGDAQAVMHLLLAVPKVAGHAECLQQGTRSLRLPDRMAPSAGCSVELLPPCSAASSKQGTRT